MSSSVSADLPGTRDVGMFLGSEFPMDQQTLLCRDNSLSLSLFLSFSRKVIISSPSRRFSTILCWFLVRHISVPPRPFRGPCRRYRGALVWTP